MEPKTERDAKCLASAIDGQAVRKPVVTLLFALQQKHQLQHKRLQLLHLSNFRNRQTSERRLRFVLWCRVAASFLKLF